MRLLTQSAVPALFGTAIVLGSIAGASSPATGELLGGWVDSTVLLLVGLLFFEVRFSELRRIRSAPRFFAVAIVANFAVIPLIGWGIATIAFGDREPALFVGLFIYFMAPCTDWFLGFTRMARGNVELGAVLLPINMILQLFLYPVYLRLFAGEQVGVDLASTGNTLVQWVVVPLVAAIVLRAALRVTLPAAQFVVLLRTVGRATPAVIALLIVQLFASNITTLLDHASSFAVILVAAIVFFVATYALGGGAARLFHLEYPEKALLVMTTASRNAPLMLGITTVAIPGQPLVYAAIIVGMLIEFPHLTVLRTLLLRTNREKVHTQQLTVSALNKDLLQ